MANPTKRVITPTEFARVLREKVTQLARTRYPGISVDAIPDVARQQLLVDALKLARDELGGGPTTATAATVADAFASEWGDLDQMSIEVHVKAIELLAATGGDPNDPDQYVHALEEAQATHVFH